MSKDIFVICHLNAFQHFVLISSLKAVFIWFVKEKKNKVNHLLFTKID